MNVRANISARGIGLRYRRHETPCKSVPTSLGNRVCEAALRLGPFLLLFAHECMMKMYYLASAVLFRGRDLLGPHDAYLFFPLSDLYFSSRTPEEAGWFNSYSKKIKQITEPSVYSLLQKPVRRLKRDALRGRNICFLFVCLFSEWMILPPMWPCNILKFSSCSDVWRPDKVKVPLIVTRNLSSAFDPPLSHLDFCTR